MEKCHLNLTAFVKDSLQLHYITFSSITLIKEYRVCTLSLCIHTPLNGTPCSHLKMFLRGQTYVSAHRMFCVEEPYPLVCGCVWAPSQSGRECGSRFLSQEPRVPRATGFPLRTGLRPLPPGRGPDGGGASCRH